jgi:RHS repeat-associated protein
MVAFAKPHRKVHTPDRSAKDSGHRFYSPEISRWLNRDLAGEQAGVNLFGFLWNSPIGAHDALGLAANDEVTASGQAKMACQTAIALKQQISQTLQAAGLPTGQTELTISEKIACKEKVNQMIANSNPVKAMWAMFSSACPAPAVACVCCPPNQGGSYAPCSMFINICWNNLKDNPGLLGKIMVHEAWHYVENKCTETPFGSDCASALKKEMLSYRCANQCDSSSTCLYRAISSACPNQCSPEQAMDAHDEVKAWYESKSATICNSSGLPFLSGGAPY